LTWSFTTLVGALEYDMFLGKEGERTEFHITLTTNRAKDHTAPERDAWRGGDTSSSQYLTTRYG